MKIVNTSPAIETSSNIEPAVSCDKLVSLAAGRLWHRKNSRVIKLHQLSAEQVWSWHHYTPYRVRHQVPLLKHSWVEELNVISTFNNWQLGLVATVYQQSWKFQTLLQDLMFNCCTCTHADTPV